MIERFIAWLRALVSNPAPTVARPRKSAPAESPASHESPAVTPADQALRSFLSQALDGGAADPFASDDDAHHQRLLDLATAALARFEVQARYLPRRPSLLPRLLSAMNSDSNSMRELAAIIGGDPTLLGNLLRVANSAFYRVSGKPIESLERAVILVGTDGIRSLIATSLMHPVMSSAGGCFAKFPEAIWEQTQYAADAAELHAAQIERADAFGARMLALLLGLATNTVFRIVRDEALGGREQGAKPAMIALLEQWTLPVASRIAESWELPVELRQALEDPASPLARSLQFGRLVGSQVSLIKRGQIKDAAARATVLAGEPRRAQAERIWNRVAVSALRPQPAPTRTPAPRDLR